MVDIQETTSLRPTGMPLRISQDDSWTYLSSSTPLAKAAANGDRDLGDDDVLSAIADRLDEHDVYGARLFARGSYGLEDVDRPMPDGAVERIDEWLIAEPFAGYAVGWGMDEDQPITVVVYDFESSDAAERAVDEVRAYWTDGRSFSGSPVADLVEVRDADANGGQVTVVLTHVVPSASGAVSMLVDQRDPIFTHR